jgi:hypothetical protein
MSAATKNCKAEAAVKSIPLSPDVIYRHAPCPDGASCEILLATLFPSAKFVQYVHGETKINPAEIKDKVVWCADVCFTLSIMREVVLPNVKFLYVIDHHANDQTKAVFGELLKHPQKARMEPLLDKNVVCASLMIHRLFFPETTVPVWLDAINKGDTDLISSRTEEEKAYHAALTSSANIEDIRQRINQDYKSVLGEGQKIVSEKVRQAQEAIKTTGQCTSVTIEGTTYNIIYVDVIGPKMISTITEQIHKQTFSPPLDFYAIRFTKDGGAVRDQISLRRPLTSSLDLAKIAAVYKGGGHPAAAGIQGYTHL